jgi:hypothetical protein
MASSSLFAPVAASVVVPRRRVVACDQVVAFRTPVPPYAVIAAVVA